MAKKYQVFISSTYEDLKVQRDEVVKTILRIGHLPIGMEMFNAGNDTQWEIIKRYIDNCDYYVVILAHRYGSEAPDGVGYTEKEYEYAQAQGVPCLGFIIHDDADWSPKLIAKGEQAIKLETFKSKIKNRMVSFWRSTDNLALLVSNGLTEAFTTHPRTGWVRSTEAASPEVLEELARLSKVNKELTDKLQAQPTDEITELQRILDKELVKLNVKGEAIEISLMEIFSIAASLPDGPSPQSIYSSLLVKTLSDGLIKNSHYSDAKGFEEALYDLLKIGVLNATNDAPGGAWYATQKGQRLYIRMRSQT